MTASSKLFHVFLTVSVSFLFFSCMQKSNADKEVNNADSLNIAAGNDYAAVDRSPVDISYYPPSFPQDKMNNTASMAAPVARIIYSRPHKMNRIIFSNSDKSLCQYGKLWRLGANEATEIEFFQPVIINNQNVAAGRYTMYCIPFEDKWILAINSNLDSWGLDIQPEKDVLRVEVPVQKQQTPVEDFTIVFAEAGYGADLIIVWDDVKAVLPLMFTK
jgi:Protein of unknown function (DUF2911)